MGGPVNCTDSELSIYLQALGEGYLATSYSDTNLSAPSKSIPIASRCYTLVNKTVSFRGFPSFRMLKNSTGSRGADSLMSCAADSPAKTSAPLVVVQESKASEVDCGARWNESLAKFDPVTCSWKTRQCLLFEDWGESLEAWPSWGIMRNGECFHARMPVAFTYANASGLRLPTPRSCTAMQARITANTAKARFPNLETVLARLTLPTIGKNENKGSSSKRFIGSPDFRGAKMSQGLRTCEADPIYLNPLFAELVMMWPAGWTDLQPLETAKFHEWLDSHGRPSVHNGNGG